LDLAERAVRPLQARDRVSRQCVLKQFLEPTFRYMTDGVCGELFLSLKSL
jgi:hypothetical protein